MACRTMHVCEGVRASRPGDPVLSLLPPALYMQALILAPTREIAIQSEQVCVGWLYFSLSFRLMDRPPN